MARPLGAQIPKLTFGPVAPEGVPTIWAPQNGFQQTAMACDAYEILVGGEKGSGKSYLLIGWLVRGNNTVSEDLVDTSYIFHPEYKALMLRKSFPELEDWREQAMAVYSKMGAVFKPEKMHIKFPSGATITLGHLGDENSFRRYFGHRIIRLAIDEVNFIGDYGLYYKLFITPRSHDPRMKAQIMLTANPEGPGLSWLRKRFVRVPNPAKPGEFCPWGRKMGETVRDPITGENKKLIRIYIHSKLSENKAMLAGDADYGVSLASNPSAALRRAYMEGDWDAFTGRFFPEFRRRKFAHEPENAIHVYDPKLVPLAPWWPRYLAMDWGFGHHSSVHKYCVNENGQLHVYDEMVQKNIGALDWGRQIAQWCLPDLELLDSHTMTMVLSQDAFGKRDDTNTIAQQIQKGMEEIIGKNCAIFCEDSDGAHLMRLTETQGKCRILLRRASQNRTSGWVHMRELMNWNQPKQMDPSKFNADYANHLLVDVSTEKYFQYCKLFDPPKKKIVPILQISMICTQALNAIETVDFDPNNSEDIQKLPTIEDDVIDELRYGCMHYKHFSNLPPANVYVDRKVEEAEGLYRGGINDNNRMLVRDRAANDWELLQQLNGTGMAPFSIGRGSVRQSTVRVN